MTTQTNTKKIAMATCLWFNKNAEDAAQFYTRTFPIATIEAARQGSVA